MVDVLLGYLSHMRSDIHALDLLRGSFHRPQLPHYSSLAIFIDSHCDLLVSNLFLDERVGRGRFKCVFPKDFISDTDLLVMAH